MAEDSKTPKSDINFEYNQSFKGLNMDSVPSQIDKGSLSYALNAAIENFDANSVTYQNEPGNEFCFEFPHNYILIGKYLIPEQAKQIFFLSSPSTGDSEIGYMYNNDCVYRTLINAKCLNFDPRYPIHKVVHRTSNCGTEIYWAQPNADRRYINLDPTKIPRLPLPGSTPCDEQLIDGSLDCNQIRVQPNYDIPQLYVESVIIGGNVVAGVYQFAIQYSDALGNPLSSFHSITNPTPLADPQIITPNFNYPVGKTIMVNVSNIDIEGQFDYFNLVVIKTINAITSVELVGTYNIDGETKTIAYSGQNQSAINLTINDIFEKFPFYGPADDVTTSQNVLIWKGLSTPERISYQQIANRIKLLWETYRIPPSENYSNEINATHLRGYLRDEVYPFEFVPLLRSGKQADGFHIPGRALTLTEASLPMIPVTDPDFIEDPSLGPQPYWRIYNTAAVVGTSPEYRTDINYKGPYNYGTFAYWESSETYPCDEDIWGDLANQPIRHHKFPDVAISPIIESQVLSPGARPTMGNDAVFPIGVRVDIQQIKLLITQSSLTDEQKADIVGFKIVRGDRTDNKSVVAKGILRNVGKYEREGQEFYYPNYPYNDLNVDPFLNSQNNAFSAECESFTVNITSLNTPAANGIPAHTKLRYVDCNTNKEAFETYNTTGVKTNLCSLEKPTLVGTAGAATVGYTSYDVWTFQSGGTTVQNCLHFHVKYEDYINGPSEAEVKAHNVSGSNVVTVRVVPGTVPQCSQHCGVCGKEIIHRSDQDVRNTSCTGASSPLPVPANEAHRQIFNSPETSFGQPFLGDVLKLESVIFGGGLAHFVEVKDNAKYKLLTAEAQRDALTSAGNVGGGDATATFTAYQAYLQIYINGITKKNYAYSFNSIADYNYSVGVPNGQGIKQRRLDLKKYLIPAVQNVGEPEIDVNNYQRESSVYLRTLLTLPALPFPHESPNMIPIGIRDISRFTVGCGGASPCIPEGTTTTTTTITTLAPAYCPGSCSNPEEKQPIQVVSYYAALKNTFRGQWGQIYAYQSIDTGYQIDFSEEEDSDPTKLLPPRVVFGGDTFISRFAFKTKLPFFIDNRVGAPDDSEIFYDELGNIAYPKYWHSARSVLESFNVPNLGTMNNIISYKAHNFDCPNCQSPAPPAPNPNRTFYDGIFYLFAYGIPNFYVESSYNVDLRQAFNNKEGEFWPHVSNSIPDEWVQESFVSIANDNTYYYNGSFSKQNIENLFTHIPANFNLGEPCQHIYPFRAIFSDPQVATAVITVNNWLTYRATSYFDFPQNYGKLTSLDGVERGQVLARFENKTLYYNALYTTQTNTNGQVYLGQSLFSNTTPPIDQAETDLGYLGSQHKFLLKIPQGQITIDAIRGQVFLLGSSSADELSSPGSGMNRFFTDHLSFEILKYFPNANIDNHFSGLGLHGVYDSKFDRVIITKLDYIPLKDNIEYDDETQEFYLVTETEGSSFRNRIFLTDQENFCNKSWTLSYSLITKSWLSFHSYLPNWYIGENNFFYSGKKDCCAPVKFIAGELVDNPITTTTTTTFPVPPTTTSTTTIAKDCGLIGGIAQATSCELGGTGVITVPPVPPPCTRPTDVMPIDLYVGYNIILPPSTVVSTASAVDACNAKTYVFTNPGDVTLNLLQAFGYGLNQGMFLYADTGTDCTPIPDGFYFTYDPDEFIYEVVSGVVVGITSCIITTTTTTTVCPMYLYNVEFYACGTCSLTSTGLIGNSQVLTMGKFYYDSVTLSRMKVISAAGCSGGSDRSILDSSQQDSCPAVACP